MTGTKIFWAVFCMIMISIPSVSAKYIRQTELTGVVNARNFYFVSDLLDGGVHQVMVKEDTMASVTLMNYINEEEYSEVDIEYVVEVRDTDKDEKSSLTVSPAAGTITKGQRNAVEIVVSGLKAGHTYKITASTDNTYAKTLTGVVKVNADDSPLCAPEADGKVQLEAEFTDSFLPETTQENTPESGEEAEQEEFDLEDLSESSEDTEPVECELLPEENETEADTKNYAEIL
ncbi:hypothetical protein [Blautia obeum]|jgi:hypothetical protein|uniref:hypothetical protein n=1 Tax=Blautia obeum TaxID=40520 RepID=UPI003568D58E